MVDWRNNCYIYVMNERELTFKALNQLQFHTGLVAKVTAYGYPHKPNSSDAHIEFDNSSAKLVAQLKRWDDDKSAAAVIDEVCAAACETLKEPAKILISDYINTELGARLRAAKVNYIDKVGNAYLDLAPIFVLIEGKVPNTSSLSDKTAKLFTETGMKVICAFLTNDDLLNANYRSVADHANVSMGTIGWVLRELRDQDYTVEEYRSRMWKNKSKLIKTWVSEYSKLKDKHQLGIRYSQDPNWWKNIDLNKYGAVFGGELAGLHQVEDNDFVPKEGVIYLDHSHYRQFNRDLRLILPEHVGENDFFKIDIRTKFWGKTQDLDLLSNTTHPFITYADLMDTWDPINISAAKKIADKYLLSNK